MVVIDDFRKQILYERLNLGYDCSYCKTKFYSKREQLQHMQEVHLKPRTKEQYDCSRCGKVFGHIQIYKLHQQIHTLSEPERKTLTEPKRIESSTQKDASISGTLPTSNIKPKTRPPSKKATGLTKVKMEDCLRCDACSCIYIDRNDYYKHMRNFHKINLDGELDGPSNVDNVRIVTPTKSSPNPAHTIIKPTVSTKPRCKSCCKHCRDNKLSKCRHQIYQRAMQKTKMGELFKFSMLDNIKNRWTEMMSQRLMESNNPLDVMIKPDPDATDSEQPFYPNSVTDSDEMSHLLSQVEVKIKTEPMDER